jgi:hypothetical protein
MFHEITESQIKKRRKIVAIVVVCVIVVCIAVWAIVAAVQANTRVQGAVALRDTILESAKQCCAIEGSYPSSLDHLEQSYGLTINHDSYVVSYEYFADNVMPSVVVTPK